MSKTTIRIITCTLVLVLGTTYSMAQIGNDVVGANATGMGGYSATLTDVWSANNNQAGLGFIQDMSGGIFYENRFLLKETSYRAGAFALPVKSGSFGLSIASFGYELYSETKAGIAYGQRFGDRFAMGVQINYLNTKLSQDYGTRNTITGAIGIISKVNDELSIGVHVYNPTRSKLADYDNERVPTVMKLGLDYKFSDKVILGVETEKDMNYDAVVRAGIEYHISELLYLRGGIGTNPTQSSFGFGLLMKNFKMDISASFHQTLGMTPGVSLVYQKAKKKKLKTISTPGF